MDFIVAFPPGLTSYRSVNDLGSLGAHEIAGSATSRYLQLFPQDHVSQHTQSWKVRWLILFPSSETL